MAWHETLLWFAGICAALLGIWKFIDTVGALAKSRILAKKATQDKIDKMLEHQNEQYLAILRLTIMTSEMPVSERIIAGKKYIELGGNGDVKAYFETLLEEHTR